MPLTRLVQCAHMRWCGEVGVGGVRGHVFGGGWAWCFAGAQIHHRAVRANKKMGLGHAHGAHACPWRAWCSARTCAGAVRWAWVV